MENNKPLSAEELCPACGRKGLHFCDAGQAPSKGWQAAQVQQAAHVGPMPIASAPTDGTKVMLWNGEEWVEGYFDRNPDIGWTTGFSGTGWPLVFSDWWMPKTTRLAAQPQTREDWQEVRKAALLSAAHIVENAHNILSDSTPKGIADHLRFMAAAPAHDGKGVV